jgi:hypothetical protein
MILSLHWLSLDVVAHCCAAQVTLLHGLPSDAEVAGGGGDLRRAAEQLAQFNARMGGQPRNVNPTNLDSNALIIF